MAPNISPEERLFNIIQETKGAGPGKKVPAKSGPIKEIISRLKNFLQPAKTGAPAHGGLEETVSGWYARLYDLDLRNINIVLGGILGFLTVLTIYYAATGVPNISKLMRKPASVGRLAAAQEKSALKPLSTYLDQIAKRDVFATGAGTAVTAAENASLKLSERVKGLKLQGIAWGETPKALIFDESENKVYIIGKGQMVGTTGIVVKDITRNKVTIASDTGEMEL